LLYDCAIYISHDICAIESSYCYTNDPHFSSYDQTDRSADCYPHGTSNHWPHGCTNKITV
jgi:hypothetical protein